MKRIGALVVLAALVGFTGLAEAENACDMEHSKALQFSFSGLSNLGVSPVQSGSIGLKKLNAPNQYLLLRAGLGISSSTSPSQTNPAWTDKKISTKSLALGAGVQQYFPYCGSNVVPYVGFLGTFSYSGSSTDESTADPPAAGATTKTTVTTIGLGAKALVGGEWFFKPCLSLSGEYTFGLGYNRTKTKMEIKDADTSEKTTSDWNFGPFSTAGLWLTVYFD